MQTIGEGKAAVLLSYLEVLGPDRGMEACTMAAALVKAFQGTVWYGG